jgi:hypothetical protein
MIEQTPSELTTQLIARAWKDEAFKEELLRDPKGVLARELAQLQPGATLPADIQIQVVEETPSTRYLVLPAKPAIESGDELSEADLQSVAGGCTGTGMRTHYEDDSLAIPTGCYQMA